ncbi:MAG: hypothetical protein ABFD54_07890 [Armatimonadota bacterium]
MPYCPECRYEYRPGFTTCPDCNVELVDELPEEQHSESEATWGDLVTVETFPYDAQAQAARLLLESHGITALVGISGISQMDMSFAAGGGVIRLQVREQDAAEAARILAEDHQQPEESV